MSQAGSREAMADEGEQGVKRRRVGLWGNAFKRKHSFVQLFLMTGVMMLSMRSLGQKYRIHDLLEDTEALREEHHHLSQRMASIENALTDEAALEPTGSFASTLKLLFQGYPPPSSE
ncbi:hypothetical protein AMTRI_Chr09g15800 [Amborella trichopoda]|uniref:Uncharacterized protein n=1 Tax=Amborella trichopoda TaxID=13333 RepID=W1NMC2_AMBTC|nr:uncharacterized protein LOC18424356 [Amborella trichopoda]ERM96424.1 hypothetical protein AMTR_s00001p00247430 [Amborella trichopoda]|eukprot:XP_006829008.1 uncharacterized protein LOC18424356 [Amborella trichopoda]